MPYRWSPEQRQAHDKRMNQSVGAVAIGLALDIAQGRLSINEVCERQGMELWAQDGVLNARMTVPQEKRDLWNAMRTLLDIGADELLPGLIDAARRRWLDDPDMRRWLDDCEMRFINSLEGREGD